MAVEQDFPIVVFASVNRTVLLESVTPTSGFEGANSRAKNGMCNQTVALFVVYSDSVSNQ